MICRGKPGFLAGCHVVSPCLCRALLTHSVQVRLEVGRFGVARRPSVPLRLIVILRPYDYRAIFARKILLDAIPANRLLPHPLDLCLYVLLKDGGKPGAKGGSVVLSEGAVVEP